MKGRISNKLGEIRINPEVIAIYAGRTAWSGCSRRKV